MAATVLVAGTLALILAEEASARPRTITIHKPIGVVGGNDIAITMLVGPVDSPFPFVLTPVDFAAADVGPFGFLVDPNPAWTGPLAADPSVPWLSTSATGSIEGSSGLYSLPFTIECSSIFSATLDIDFLVDNALGDPNNEGVFINAQPVVGSTLFVDPPSASHFQVDQSFPTFDITSLVNPGLNRVYLNAPDQGGPSGLRFIVEITTECNDEPIGGEILPIDMTALFVAGTFTNAFWILPTLGGIAGAAFALFKINRKHD